MTDLRAAWAQDTARLLQTLSPGTVAVLTLRYFARLDENEICARTGMSAQRVRALSAAGLRELGRMLQPQPHDSGVSDIGLVAAGAPSDKRAAVSMRTKA